ncbi:helix-turn-helix domain-containing protein [Halosimplex aquaticum]|uniref:Helix-turn-helix domain-containing protein n=1 Tax=Halosimplex aquaticum TaxID=3026162 RepID=A0ABD5XXY1_9EURY|nr:helix-turn-helix domain-containing protein [Halosimplex aquaticum]
MTEETASDRGSTTRDLYVVFEVEPSPESDCPLGDFDGRVDEIRQQFAGDDCHTDTTVRTSDCDCEPESECTEVMHTTSPVEDSCPCAVFGEFGCVPELSAVGDGRIVLETYLPDRDHLSELVDALKGVADGLRLRQLKRIENGTAERNRDTVTLDLFEVTEKQREAVTKAVTAGYYESPRETSLGELADDLDISKSALTQRLNGVESKLATAAFAEVSAD